MTDATPMNTSENHHSIHTDLPDGSDPGWGHLLADILDATND